MSALLDLWIFSTHLHDFGNVEPWRQTVAYLYIENLKPEKKIDSAGHFPQFCQSFHLCRLLPVHMMIRKMKEVDCEFEIKQAFRLFDTDGQGNINVLTLMECLSRITTRNSMFLHFVRPSVCPSARPYVCILSNII